jgi:hypothetical protein
MLSLARKYARNYASGIQALSKLDFDVNIIKRTNITDVT